MVATDNGRALPECWGHRGASARFPENTLASFEAAMRDGAEGIESDVHVSLDDVVIMFHDSDLTRTTTSTGHIKHLKWYGPDGMEHARTKKEPAQSIPTFAQTVALLMKPENKHVKFNVDIKPDNDPDRLFCLMHKIVTAQPNWETELAPRILLGLWHTKFVVYAKARMPYCDRSYLGNSIALAREFFWDECTTFSMSFASMVGLGGERFRAECKKAGKKLMVWTVNEPQQMVEVAKWGADGIITDHTQVWLGLRKSLSSDYDKTLAKHNRWFLWTNWRYWSLWQFVWQSLVRRYIERVAGPFAIGNLRITETPYEPEPKTAA